MTRTPEDARKWTDEGTALLLAAVGRLDDDALTAPSALPGWTRRHLLAHVAANAEALRNLLAWARTGVETPMYASPEQRDRDIADRARRSPADLRESVARSARALAGDAEELTAEQWRHQVRTAQGRAVPASEVAWLRAREVLVHAVDLDAGVRFTDLPRDFLAALLDDVAAKRAGTGPALELVPADDERTWAVPGDGPATRLRGPLAELAAYLAGRRATGLDPTPPPALPRWL